MSRNLLHRDHLERFKAWLDSKGIEHRPGRGEWQVLQVQQGKHWISIYERAGEPEHLTVDRRINAIVAAYCHSRKG